MSLETDNSYLNGAPFFERVMFANRGLIIVASIILTLFLGNQMMQMKPEASFLRMIPTYHPYIKNYIAHKKGWAIWSGFVWRLPKAIYLRRNTWKF